MTRNLKLIALVALICYVVFSSFVIKSEEKKQLCKAVALSFVENPKDQLVTQSTLMSLLDAKHIQLKNTDWHDININKVEKIIEQHPAIKKTACIRTPSNKCEIKIQQYTPLYRVITSKDSYYVSSEKTIIPTSQSAAALTLIASGSISNQFATGELFELVNYIHQDPLLQLQIEQIFVDANGALILTPRVGKQKIIFGTATDYQQKFANLKALYAQGFTKTGWSEYVSINLKYENQVVCTRAN